MTDGRHDVIEISSSDEDAPPTTVTKTAGSPTKSLAKISLLTRIQGKRGPFVRTATKRVVHEQVVYVSSESESEPEKSTPPTEDLTEPLLYSPVKASHKEVIDLSFSSEDERDIGQPRPTALRRLVKGSRPEAAPALASTSASSSLCAASSGSDKDVGFKERMLVPEDSESASSSSSESDDDTPVILPTPRSKPTPRAKPTLSRAPRPQSVLDTPSRPASDLVKKGKAPRITKKALREAEQARREKYAEELFKELNTSVFNDGLPTETKLNWSNRLLTTAGRAKWRRSRDGTQTTEIELATKVLDSDDRIRNTLSHEMCHLACWVINGDPKEGHGRAFKAWASKVTRKRPDITVSTRHNYEINYPYEWECDNCAKVYGRYSKSIRPDECRCGTCKVGKLVPLFKTRVTSKAKTTSKAITTTSDGQHVVSSLLDSFIDLTVTSKSSTKGSGSSALTVVDELKALTEELQGLSPIDWTPVS